jgi:hypothetical protein
LHVLFGCHRTAGTHLISKQPGNIGTGPDSWETGAQIAVGISYPTVFRVYDNKELIYYRTNGHSSSWTYRVSDDNGKTWAGPARDVTDMDINGRSEWSSYQTTLPGKHGKFLYVLSAETLEDHLYYYVRRISGKWKQTPIVCSNHQWNSCHLTRDDNGTLHAYLIRGDGYLDTGSYMDRHGGGTIEEWISSDKGNTWKKERDLTPDKSRYPGWSYNNIQPVRRPDGSIVDGMLLFYGWEDKDAPEAKAFLLHEDNLHDPSW